MWFQEETPKFLDSLQFIPQMEKKAVKHFEAKVLLLLYLEL